MPLCRETRLFDAYLESILPVRHVEREPVIPVTVGDAARQWRADYLFTLNSERFVAEVKLAPDDMPINGMKVLAYEKLYQLHTKKSVKPLIVTRAENTNLADLMVCGLLKVSILTVRFEPAPDRKIRFKGLLDGTTKFEHTFEATPGF